jgi:hypothetical protein
MFGAVMARHFFLYAAEAITLPRSVFHDMKDAATRASLACKERLRSLLSADYVFVAATATVVGCKFYFGPRIKRERIAMQWGERRQADMARPAMGCAVMDDTVHDRGPLYYLAGFDVRSAKRSRGRIGHRAFLGDSRCVAHIRFEGGGKAS